MDTDNLRRESYSLQAQVCQVLSHPKRLEILDLLSEGEKSLEELTQALNVSKSNVSQHLSLMRKSNLLNIRKDGLRAIYRVSNLKLLEAWALMRELALEQVEAVESLMKAVEMDITNRESVDKLSLADLIERMESGTVVLLDVRPPQEYEKGHIPGALPIPLELLDQNRSSFTKDQELIAYCRGPYCALSDQAIRRLQELGYKAKKLNVGFPEWKQAGFPVETGGPG